jgi:hypothetical protein
MWESCLRSRAKDGERVVLDALRDFAAQNSTRIELRAVELGSDGDYSNPRRVLGVRSGEVTS